MKIQNIGLDNAYAIVRGWVSGLTASSTGLVGVSDNDTTVGPANTMTFINASVTDAGGGGVTVEVFGATISPTALAANTDNWSPTDLVSASIIRVDLSAAWNLTGIVAPVSGERKWLALQNISAFTLTLKHNVTSTAANRFYGPNDADLAVLKDSSVLLWYDLTTARWRVMGGGGSTITEANLTLSDVTTDDVTSTKHGFAPKSPADATKFLNGAATPAYAQVKDSDLSTTDITTNDVTTAKHGFAPKLPNDATRYLDGTGAYSAPTVSGGTSSIAYSSGDITTTGSLADVTGCSLSLIAGTYIIAGTFDVLVNNALNDRTFEGHLDSGGSDQTNTALLVALGLVNDRGMVVQHWKLTLSTTTTVKLRAKYSGGTAGDFTVKAQSSISAWTAAATNSVPPVSSMPVSPATNDRVYRTDLAREFYYDGTRWLSTTLFKATLQQSAISYSATAAAAANMVVPYAAGGSDIWLVEYTLSLFVGSGTALGASHKWVATMRKYDINDTATTFATATLDSGSSGVWRSIATAIGALLGATFFRIASTYTKTGTPGGIQPVEELTYRIVAT